MDYTATYSPDDNKLRLYAASRLPRELYDRVRDAGFRWAPKQELFVAPAWSPHREDLLLELAGDIGDEDQSLSERAEARADRFDEYSEKRLADAESARKAVSAIADHIPLGQPILIGHHSERRARKDAERIENGMRKAVKMWNQSDYWTRRAASAIAHADYKERADVRARRIKGLESELRKQEKNRGFQLAAVRLWESLHDDVNHHLKRKDGATTTFAERALWVAGHTNSTPFGTWADLNSGKITPERAQEMTLKAARGYVTHCERWITHYQNRLAYERAMLAESGGTVADRTGPEQGGGCKCWASPRGGWSYIQKVNKVSVTVLDNWGNGGANFTRTIPFDKLAQIMTAAEVQAARACGTLAHINDTGFAMRDAPLPTRRTEAEAKPEAAAFDAIKESLRAGIQALPVAQLFPTPPELAARMVATAAIRPGDRVLEPSAGTGNLIRAIPDNSGAAIVAVEINQSLADRLESPGGMPAGIDVHCEDFLQWYGDVDLFDRIIMNPPFVNGADIAHIKHAVGLLKPGGRLVALCANGPRQQEQLRPLASEWLDLPDGTFKESGTNVNTAMLVIGG